MLEKMPEAETDACVMRCKNGEPVKIAGYDKALPPELLRLCTRETEDIAVSADKTVAIHTGLTGALKTEGIYREILRHCQVLRKESGFEVLDKVVLWFETDAPELLDAVEGYKEELMSETLSEVKRITDPVMEREVRFREGSLTIKIGKN
jgi:isoleucyl-tRNA synthetase